MEFITPKEEQRGEFLIRLGILQNLLNKIKANQIRHGENIPIKILQIEQFVKGQTAHVMK